VRNLWNAVPSIRRGETIPVLQHAGLASLNVDGNPGNDRVPWGNQFITGKPDLSYANGNSFSKLKSWGLSAIVDYDVSDAVALEAITAYREGHWLSGLDADGVADGLPCRVGDVIEHGRIGHCSRG